MLSQETWYHIPLLTREHNMGKQSDTYFKTTEQIRPGAVILINPRFGHNVGTALRTTACFCHTQIVVTGQRIRDEVDNLRRIPREERMRNYADVELIHCDDPFAIMTPECVPVAMEFRPNSECLYDFVHPENAVYIFGPEDGTLGGNILSRSHSFVKIDTLECLNLATAITVTLYDRELKIRQRSLVGV